MPLVPLFDNPLQLNLADILILMKLTITATLTFVTGPKPLIAINYNPLQLIVGEMLIVAGIPQTTV
jgi:hypothetical protein